MGRFLTLILILGACLGAAKPKVDLVWQRGTLFRIMPDYRGSRLMFQTQDGGTCVAFLNDLQREPNVHIGKEYKFALETVKCLLNTCGSTNDQFGRPHPIRTRQVMHLIDEDGREIKLDPAQFKPGRTD